MIQFNYNPCYKCKNLHNKKILMDSTGDFLYKMEIYKNTLELSSKTRKYRYFHIGIRQQLCQIKNDFVVYKLLIIGKI